MGLGDGWTAEEEVTRTFDPATLEVWRALTHFMASRHPVVFNAQTLPNLLEHIPELSSSFQETYLNSVACKDCSHCGKHVFYSHGDHVHRLCKSPWYFSPYLNLEDLPDIERLVEWIPTSTAI